MKFLVQCMKSTYFIIYILFAKENHIYIKKKCRAGGKSRARDDQNHIIFFTSPKAENVNDQTLKGTRYRSGEFSPSKLSSVLVVFL